MNASFVQIVAFLVKIAVQFLVSDADIAALFLEFFVESDFLIVASFVVLADPSFEFFAAVVSQIPEAVDPFDLIIKMIIDHSLHFYF